MAKLVICEEGTPEHEQTLETMRVTNRSLIGQIVESLVVDETGARVTAINLSNGWEIGLSGFMLLHTKKLQ